MRANVREIRVTGGVLEDLYVRHATDATRLAYLLTGDRAVAEDLAHDAFVRMAGRFLHLRDPGGCHAYLRTTVVNLARAHHRRLRIGRRAVERWPVDRVDVVQPDVAGREVVRLALLALPERQRTAIVLRFFEDLSEAQTAAIMRCRVGTVKSLVARAKDALRTSIGGE